MNGWDGSDEHFHKVSPHMRDWMAMPKIRSRVTFEPSACVVRGVLVFGVSFPIFPTFFLLLLGTDSGSELCVYVRVCVLY